jgi:hypothetical protein
MHQSNFDELEGAVIDLGNQLQRHALPPWKVASIYWGADHHILAFLINESSREFSRPPRRGAGILQ